jgi:hypothetical protein
MGTKGNQSSELYDEGVEFDATGHSSASEGFESRQSTSCFWRIEQGVSVLGIASGM